MMTLLPVNPREIAAMNPAKYLALVKKDDIKGTLKEIWTMPYDADPILEPEFTGLTYGQVILMEQAKRAIGGDGGAVDRILDRLIGKPEQINKNMNISGTYAEWLEQIDKMEKETIDVEPTTTRSDQPTLE